MCRAGGGGEAEGELTVRVRIHTTTTLHTRVTYWEEKDIMTEKVAKKYISETNDGKHIKMQNCIHIG